MKMIQPSAASEFIRRMMRKLDGQPVDALGVLSYEEADGTLDAGGYGDPHTDTRPDFVKAELKGWEPLGRGFWR